MSRLIYIANIRLPTEKAHGIQIMKTCEALVNEGVGVELIVPNRRNPLDGNPFSFYEVEQRFKFHRVQCVDFLAVPFFKKAGFLLESLSFCFAAKQYVSNHSADVYYTRDLIIAFFLSRLYKTVFYEIHTLPARATFFHRRAWKWAKGIIVISDGLKTELMGRGVPENKILVARDAVDLKQFKIFESKEECRKKLGLSADKKIVVYTGHLYEWKGASILAEAAKFSPKDSNIEVYIVGGTPEDTEAFRKKYGNVDRLHIVGWRPHQEMPFWHSAADILVVPTSAKGKIGAVYTSPMKLFEYMMSQRPIVASNIPSLHEVLDDTNAFFFKPDDPVSLAETIKKVVVNYPEAEAKAEKAYEEVVEKYSWMKRTELIKNFIFNQHG